MYFTCLTALTLSATGASLQWQTTVLAQQASYELLQDELAGVMSNLAQAEATLSESVAKKAQLEDEVALCSAKLDRAAKLIGGLGGEKVCR